MKKIDSQLEFTGSYKHNQILFYEIKTLNLWNYQSIKFDYVCFLGEMGVKYG